MKRFSKIILFSMLLIFFGIQSTVKADSENTNDDAINEKFGLPIVVYGESLSASQKEETSKLLGVEDSSKVEEITVTAKDLVRLINGDARSRMFSSAKITRKEKGEGLVIDIVTPDDITQVTNEMYANALLTAGIEDARVQVASPVKVTGHSALVGIYKAYETGTGEELNKGRMEVANDELSLATDLAEKEGMDQEKVTELLTEIKKEIASQKPATKEDVEKIVEDQLKKLDIQLSPEDRQLLVNLFDRMRELDIDFDNVKTQLGDIASDIKKRVEDAVGNQGFWQGVLNFFRDMFQSIANLFK